MALRSFCIIGEGGVVVSAGLHGIVPEPELPLFVVLRSAAVVEDALHCRPDRADPFVVVEIFSGDDGALCEKRFHCEFAEQGAWAFGSDAAGNVAVLICGSGEAQNPVAEILRVRWVLIGPVKADEEAIPVPHLVVVAGGDQIGVLDVSVGGADGLGGKAVEVGGQVVEERGGVRLVGGRLGCRESTAERRLVANRNAEQNLTRNDSAGRRSLPVLIEFFVLDATRREQLQISPLRCAPVEMTGVIDTRSHRNDFADLHDAFAAVVLALVCDQVGGGGSESGVQLQHCLEIEVANGMVVGGCTGGKCGDAAIDLDADEASRMKDLASQDKVWTEVVIPVERRSVSDWIHNGETNHAFGIHPG